MAMTQKMSDVGWIYHAPAKHVPRAPVMEMAPASQIPGLNEFPEGYFPTEEPKKMQIHEHDSAYIRLAKQGGRPDLLRQRTPKEAPKEAKAYPRVDWFYQDDIRMENEINNPPKTPENYEFNLPEYMVHQEYRPYGDPPSSNHKHRNIIARDQSTVFQREGQSATDKRVKIQESRAPGYGIRNERKAPAAQKVQPMVKAKPPSPELQTAYAKLRTMPAPKEEEKPPMSKLLSFGYARDWEEQREQWEAKNGPCKPHGKPEHNETEYQSHMVGVGEAKKPRVPSHGRRAPPSAQSQQSAIPSQHRRQKTTDVEDKPDFFSLSKHADSSPKKASSRRIRSELLPAVLKPQ